MNGLDRAATYVGALIAFACSMVLLARPIARWASAKAVVQTAARWACGQPLRHRNLEGQSPTYIVGTGPTELHAHIDLQQRADQLKSCTDPHLIVISSTRHDGHWSILAEAHDWNSGQRQ